jgi:hypothetical protein
MGAARIMEQTGREDVVIYVVCVLTMCSSAADAFSFSTRTIRYALMYNQKKKLGITVVY